MDGRLTGPRGAQIVPVALYHNLQPACCNLGGARACGLRLGLRLRLRLSLRLMSHGPSAGGSISAAVDGGSFVVGH